MLTSAPAWAQGGLGIRGGVNLSTVTIDAEAVFEFSRRMDLVGGLFFVANADGPIGLQIEGLYSRRGSALTAGSETGDLTLVYLDIPAMLRIRATELENGRVFLLAGASLGFNLSATIVADGSSAPDDVSAETEARDFSLMFGAGADIGRFTFDGRYMHGISDIDPGPGPALQNRTLMFTAGVFFD